MKTKSRVCFVKQNFISLVATFALSHWTTNAFCRMPCPCPWIARFSNPRIQSLFAALASVNLPLCRLTDSGPTGLSRSKGCLTSGRKSSASCMASAFLSLSHVAASTTGWPQSRAGRRPRLASRRQTHYRHRGGALLGGDGGDPWPGRQRRPPISIQTAAGRSPQPALRRKQYNKQAIQRPQGHTHRRSAGRVTARPLRLRLSASPPSLAGGPRAVSSRGGTGETPTCSPTHSNQQRPAMWPCHHGRRRRVAPPTATGSVPPCGRAPCSERSQSPAALSWMSSTAPVTVIQKKRTRAIVAYDAEADKPSTPWRPAGRPESRLQRRPAVPADSQH